MPADWLHKWLHSALPDEFVAASLRVNPAFANASGHVSHATEVWMVSVAVAAALLSSGIALALYRRGPSRPIADLVAAIGPIYRGALNKWYIDEIYQFLVVRPLRGLAWLLRVAVDEFFIDKFLVTGVSYVVYGVGWLGSLLQSGRVRQYLAAVLVGLAALLFLVVRSVSTFDVKVAGPQVTVRAGNPGDKVIGVERGRYALKVGWDFTGDGKIDRWSRTASEPATWRYAKPGEKRIRMVVKDPRFGTTTTTDRTVRIGEGR